MKSKQTATIKNNQGMEDIFHMGESVTILSDETIKDYSGITYMRVTCNNHYGYTWLDVTRLYVSNRENVQ